MKKRYNLPEAGTATDATKKANALVSERLPLSDRTDFKNARRGLIASIDSAITTDDGRIAFDTNNYAFLDGSAAETVNPSLWRQSQLNAIHGLFEVADGIYQIRGYDISVMTLIRGEKGWIVVDCLLTVETAKAALRLAMEHLGERPVSAVLITHTHGDHFFGSLGVLSREEAAKGDIPIIVPEGYTEYSISEAVLGGNVMARRSMYQFGLLLSPGPAGHVDAGIGKAHSKGTRSFMLPTKEISKTGERLTIDGVEFLFQMASGTEAPAEFVFYLPGHKALCMAEVTCHTMHNIIAPRGTKVRDPLLWSACIDEIADRFGAEADVCFAGHNWPVWGKDNINSFLLEQRDLYRYIHDQTLRLANNGHTPMEIAELVKEPEFLKNSFSVRPYYGTLNHNIKATYQRYFGYFDGNPANLDPLPPEAAGKNYVQAMGGPDSVLDKAWEAFEEDDYRWCVTLLNHLIFADPENKTAREMLASSYEQLGFQAESVIWRNFYLCAAVELRDGVKSRKGVSGVNEDIVMAMPPGDFFNLLAVKLDPEKAKSIRLVINFEITDKDEKVVVTVGNQVENHRIGSWDKKADLSVTLTQLALNDIATGRVSVDECLAKGRVRVDGKGEVLKSYIELHDSFDLWFNIVEP